MSHEAYREAIEADDRWSKLLRERFGKNACNIRYTTEGQGEEGSELRAAYEARTKASRHWEEVMQRDRANPQRGMEAER